jgi:hypothetical protein
MFTTKNENITAGARCVLSSPHWSREGLQGSISSIPEPEKSYLPKGKELRMKDEFKVQFNHTWNILEGIVGDFDDATWINLGHGYIVPVRLAYHILHSTKIISRMPPRWFFPPESPWQVIG